MKKIFFLIITFLIISSNCFSQSNIERKGWFVKRGTEIVALMQAGWNLSVAKLNGVIYIDGIVYPRTSAGIQAAVDSVSAGGTAEIVIPLGTAIDFTSTVSYTDKGIRFRAGSGLTGRDDGVVFRKNAAWTTGPMISATQNGTISFNYRPVSHFEGISFDGNNEAGGILELTGFLHGTIKDCHIVGFPEGNSGVNLVTSASSSPVSDVIIEHCYITGGTYSLNIDGTAGSYVTQVVVSNSWFNAPADLSGNTIRVTNGSLKLDSSYIETNGSKVDQVGLYVTGNSWVSIDPTTQFDTDGNTSIDLSTCTNTRPSIILSNTLGLFKDNPNVPSVRIDSQTAQSWVPTSIKTNKLFSDVSVSGGQVSATVNTIPDFSMSFNFEGLEPGLYSSSQLTATAKKDSWVTFKSARSATSPATYCDEDQLVITATVSDKARKQYGHYSANGFVVAPGIMIESTSTNLVPYSNAFGGATWTKTNMTVDDVDAGSSSPDGTATAPSITATDANGTFLLATPVTGRTYSVFLKRKTGTGDIDITGDSGSTWTTVTTYADKWVRVFITAATATSQTCGVRIVTSGDAVYLWGAQFEDGSRMTSLIPTSGTALTRNIETLKPAIDGMTPTGDTVFIKFVTPTSFSSASGARSLYTTSLDRRVILLSTGNNIQNFPNATDSSACNAQFSASTLVTADVPHILAMRSQQGVSPYASGFLDGVKRGDETVDDFITPVWSTYFAIGTDYNATASGADFVVQQFIVHPAPLSDSEIISTMNNMAVTQPNSTMLSVVSDYKTTFSVTKDGYLESSSVNGVIYIDGRKFPRTSAGLQAAVDSIPTSGAGTIVLPAGRILLTDPVIYENKSISWIGQESRVINNADDTLKTVLYKSGTGWTSDEAMIQVTNNLNYDGVGNVIFKNLWFDGGGKVGAMLRVLGLMHSKFENLDFYNTATDVSGVGLDMDTSTGSSLSVISMENVRTRNCYYGVKIANSNVGKYVTEFNVSELYTAAPRVGGAGFFVDGSAGNNTFGDASLKFVNCYLENGSGGSALNSGIRVVGKVACAGTNIVLDFTAGAGLDFDECTYTTKSSSFVNLYADQKAINSAIITHQAGNPLQTVEVTGLSSLRRLKILDSNITYIPIAGNIQDYVTAASPGDKLILAAGDYARASTVNVAANGEISGQGIDKTTLTLTTSSNIYAFNCTASNIKISNMTINVIHSTSTTSVGGILFSGTEGDILTGCEVENVKIVITTSTAAAYGINYSDASGTYKNCFLYPTTSGAKTAIGVMKQNASTAEAPTTTYGYNTFSIANGAGSHSSAYSVYDNSATEDAILYLYNCYGTGLGSATVSAGARAYNGANAILNIYNGGFDGALTDILQSNSATVNVYGDVKLVNNTVSGTVNYYGTTAVNNISLFGNVTSANIPTYADNAAAVSGGLAVGTFYKTATGELRIVI